jgi:repressor LexA
VAEQLTDRQREVLELFTRAVHEGRPAPTFREICSELDMGSTNAASCHVRALVKKGWLERSRRGLSRGLMLTDHSRRMYGLPGRAA